MAFNAGNAFVTVTPRFTGFQRSVSSQMGDIMPGAGKSAGNQFGRSVGQGATAGINQELPGLRRAAEDAGKAVQSSADRAVKARDIAADAAGKLRVAEEKLNALRESGKATPAQMAAAEEGLATAQRKVEASSLNAERAQKTYTEEMKKSSAAQEILKTATEKTANASEAAAGKYSGGWGAVKGKLRDIQAELPKIASKMKTIGDSWKDAGKKIGDVGSSMSKKFTAPLAVAATGAAGLIGALGFKRLVGLDTARGQFKGLGLDVEAVMDQVDKGVTDTSLSMADGAALAVGILATGNLPLKDLEAQIKRTANVSAAYGVESEHAGYLLNNVLTKNKVTYGDLAQMTQNNIPIISQLADHYGVAGGAIQDMAKNGEISIEDFNKVIDKNAGAAAGEYAKTWKGVTSNIMANLGKLGAEVLDGVFPQMKDQATEFLAILKSDQVKTFANEVGGVLADAFARTVQVIKGAVEWFTNLSPAFQKIILGAAGFLVVAGPLLIIVGKIAMGVGALISFGGAFVGVLGKIVPAFKALNLVMKANLIGIIITAIALLVGAFIYLWNTNEGFRSFFIGAWEAIKNAVVGAWESYIRPVFLAINDFIQNKLMPVIRWLYENVVKPYFTAIATAVAVAIALVVATVNGLIYVWKNALAPAIKWAWDAIIKPVFSALGSFFSWVWNSVLKPAFNALKIAFQAVGTFLKWVWDSILKPVFKALGDFFKWVWNTILRPAFDAVKWYFQTVATGMKSTWNSVLKPVFQALGTFFKWVWETILRPAFENLWRGFGRVADTIKSFWNDKLKPVFQALGDFIRDKVAPVFQKGVDKIKSIWQTIEGFAKKPISFVINTVINDGLIGAFNKVAGWIPGVKTLDPVKVPGFARGGWTGPGHKYQEAGVVHADEFVVRKESQRSLARKAPGFLDSLNRFGAKALGFAKGGLVHPMDPAHRRVSAGWHGYKGHVGTDYPAPVGTPVHSPGPGTVANRGWNLTGGTGKQVWINHDNGLLSRVHHLSDWLVGVGQRVTAGQAVGRVGMTGNTTGPHAHWGVMDGSRYLNPASIWGSGAGGSGDFYGGGGGGGFSPLSFITDAAGKLVSQFADRFPGGGHMVGIAKGTGTKLFADVTEWAKNKLASIGDVGRDIVTNTTDLFTGKGGVRKEVQGVAMPYGWGGGEQWRAIQTLVQRESSWNMNAANPNSSARGLFQKMTSLHGPIEGTAAGQAKWGLDYIKGRYGNPLNALAFHNRNNSYADGGAVTPLLNDNGGVVPTGLSTILNNSRKPEAILNNQQWKDIHSLAVGKSNGNGQVSVTVVAPEKATANEYFAEARHQLAVMNRRGGNR